LQWANEKQFIQQKIKYKQILYPLLNLSLIMILPNNKSFLFHTKGQRGIYEIRINIEDEKVHSSCTCSHHKPCKHIQNVFLGRTEKFFSDEADSLKELLQIISNLPEGRNTIEAAKQYFQSETSCRRCNSRNIVDTKGKSLMAKFYKAFARHRYYCKDCRWSW